MTNAGVEPGFGAPLGATVRNGGVNFSVFSRNATLVELLLFESERAKQPSRVIPLEPSEHRSYHCWHAFVACLGSGQTHASFRRCIDTALPSPHDIQPWESALPVEQATYLVQPRSIVLLACALEAPGAPNG